jgi:hypothetical protein
MIFVMEMGCVFFEVQTELLNIIQMSFGFKGLNWVWSDFDIYIYSEDEALDLFQISVAIKRLN